MDLVDFLKEHKVEFRQSGEHHHTTSGWVQVDCPYCSQDSKKFRLGLNAKRRAANCWGCGKKKLFHSLMLLTNQPSKVVFEAWGALDALRPNDAPAAVGKYEIPAGVGELLKPHVDYLKGRGFKPEKLQRLWGIGGIGIAAKLSWRIFIPIYADGRAVSWTTRSISDDVTKRYHSAGKTQESVSHKELLYGEEYCRHSVVVHEGPFDVYRTGPGATCTFGTAFTSQQILKIAKYPVRVVCFDNNADGRKASDDLCRKLESFDGETYQVFLSAKDAGASSKKEIKELRDKFLNF